MAFEAAGAIADAWRTAPGLRNPSVHQEKSTTLANAPSAQNQELNDTGPERAIHLHAAWHILEFRSKSVRNVAVRAQNRQQCGKLICRNGEVYLAVS